MILTQQHIINKNNVNFKSIDELCYLSKNLFNSALYLVKRHFEQTGKTLRYNQLQKILKNKSQQQYNDYKKLPAAVSQNVLMVFDQNIKSFFALLKKWKKNKKSLTGCPKLQKYKHKTKGRNNVIFRGQIIRFKDNHIIFPKRANLQPIKTKAINCKQQIKQVRLIPTSGCYKVQIVYQVHQKQLKDTGIKAAIDLGLNNLMTVTFNKNYTPMIINGKPLKSMNQYYNKKLAKMKSKTKTINDSFTSNTMKQFTAKRNNKIKDYLHKKTRIVVNYLLSRNVDTLIIGKNKDWKQQINLGKRTNQNFVSIPFAMIISMLQYKCKLEGINVIVHQQSYTSKCSALDLQKICKHQQYVGKRVKRGLFRTSTGSLINADVNGSLNIGRKVIGDEFIPADRGFVVNPVII